MARLGGTATDVGLRIGRIGGMGGDGTEAKGRMQWMSRSVEDGRDLPRLLLRYGEA